jgi:hypothetical protein
VPPGVRATVVIRIGLLLLLLLFWRAGECRPTLAQPPDGGDYF